MSNRANHNVNGSSGKHRGKLIPNLKNSTELFKKIRAFERFFPLSHCNKKLERKIEKMIKLATIFTSVFRN